MTKKGTKPSDEEVCNIAFDIALEEAFAVCNTPEGKQRAFNECAALLGIDDASTLSAHCHAILEDFADEKKREKICYDFRNIRAVVMCTAWREIENRHISFREAISAAWAEVKRKCADVGAYI